MISSSIDEGEDSEHSQRRESEKYVFLHEGLFLLFLEFSESTDEGQGEGEDGGRKGVAHGTDGVSVCGCSSRSCEENGYKRFGERTFRYDSSKCIG